MGVYHFLRYPGGLEKAVTLSYDDASGHDRKLMEIIEPYGLRCTFNIPSGWLGVGNHLTAEEAVALYGNSRHEVAIHCSGHTAPGKTSYQMIAREVGDDRRTLEKLFGRIICGMAYPDSGINRINDGKSLQEITKLLSMLGIVYARTTQDQTDSERFMLPSDYLTWNPTCHHTDPRLMEFVQTFLEKDLEKQYISYREPLLFYLWGHSFEFANNDNWQVLEDFAKAVGNRDDIWYATNMEIYRYHAAYKSLIFSYEDCMVENPTSIPVWFVKKKKLYCIQPGETLDCTAES